MIQKKALLESEAHCLQEPQPVNTDPGEPEKQMKLKGNSTDIHHLYIYSAACKRCLQKFSSKEGHF